MNRKGLIVGIIFAFGLLLGWHTNEFVHIRPLAAMPMGSMSVADREMNSAMSRMDGKMHSMRMSGDADRDFMMMMIPHHRSAVDMARIELRYGKRPALKSLARDIITSQSREIGQMQMWLRAWYGVR